MAIGYYPNLLLFPIIPYYPDWEYTLLNGYNWLIQTHFILATPLVGFGTSDPRQELATPLVRTSQSSGSVEWKTGRRGWQRRPNGKEFDLPSGKHTKNYGKSPFFMGKLNELKVPFSRASVR